MREIKITKAILKRRNYNETRLAAGDSQNLVSWSLVYPIAAATFYPARFSIQSLPFQAVTST
jgi:hypothetical protein